MSVHGANRLGGNSLLDLVVFGRASGLYIENALRDGIEMRDASESDLEAATARLDKLNSTDATESVADLRKELQNTMQNHFGVFRNGRVHARRHQETGWTCVSVLKTLVWLTRAWRLIRLVSRRWSCTTCYWKWRKPQRLQPKSAKRAAGHMPVKISRTATTKTGCATPCTTQQTRALASVAVNFEPKTVDTFQPKARVY